MKINVYTVFTTGRKSLIDAYESAEAFIKAHPNKEKARNIVEQLTAHGYCLLPIKSCPEYRRYERT